MKLSKFFSLFLCIVAINQLSAHSHNGRECYQSKLAKLESAYARASRNAELTEEIENVRQACVLVGHDVKDKAACDQAIKTFHLVMKRINSGL